MSPKSNTDIFIPWPFTKVPTSFPSVSTWPFMLHHFVSIFQLSLYSLSIYLWCPWGTWILRVHFCIPLGSPCSQHLSSNYMAFFFQTPHPSYYMKLVHLWLTLATFLDFHSGSEGDVWSTQHSKAGWLCEDSACDRHWLHLLPGCGPNCSPAP